MDTATNLQQETSSKDEVDFIRNSHNNNNQHNNNNNNINVNNLTTNNNNKMPKTSINNNTNQNNNSSSNNNNQHKTPKERLTLFGFSKKSKSLDEKPKTATEKESTAQTDSGFPCQPTPVPIGTPPRHNKFVKSSSLSRLLGSTYHAKKFDKEEKKSGSAAGKFNTYGGRRRSSGPYLERFKRYAKDDSEVATPPVVLIEKTMNTNASDTLDSEMLPLEHFQEPRSDDLGSKAMRTISRGLGKLWWKRTHSVDISSPDPEFKVSYLGNVLTGWAKGKKLKL